MKAIKTLSGKLNDYIVRNDDLKISQWHFTFGKGKSVSVGMKDNEIGGPYMPPASRKTYGGAAYIRWADGTISNSKINAETLENIDLAIKEWKALSYQNLFAPEVIEPLPIPSDLKLKDDKLVEIIDKDIDYLFEILNFYKNKLSKKDYTKIITLQTGVEHEHNAVLNSKGLNAEWEETGIGIGVIVNSIAGDFYGKRKKPEKEDLKKIIKEIDQYMIHSRNILQMKPGKMPIILTPSVLTDFFGHYLTGPQGNLQGGIVANNQSIFSLDDFKLKKQAFGERISLTIDGLKDYEVSTVPCSGEGVPSTKQYIISDGRLITPFLDLKYSKKTGMPPTSLGKVGLEIKTKMPYNRLLRGIGYGLIVYDVMGMHTQETKTGDYSIAVGQGLLVENGEIKGKIKPVSIQGNFFGTLRDEKTKFTDYREDELAILTEADVTV